ncbi:MAG: hypothetical protein F4X34_07965 [Chloroflexi bacterium]|nr:hypothetical protein [Chloroflexota bacterium]
MDKSSTAIAAARSVAHSSTSVDALHHHAWLVLQTGLGHAARAVLHTIVEAHAHFQARSDDQTFFMARSRLEPILPRGMQWRTFTNHRSALVRLGLLELVWRAPNQHSGKSLWRIRYDRTISAQPREQLALPMEEFKPLSDSHLEAVPEPIVPVGEVVGPGTHPEMSDDGPVEKASLGRQIAQMKLWLASCEQRLAELEARFDALVATERGDAPEVVGSSETIPRAERRRRARQAVKQARGSPSDVKSPFLQRVAAAMKEMNIALAGDDLRRFREVEELWREFHTGELPEHFLRYAVQRMREAKRDRPIGYVLGVLRSTVRKGYTEDMPSGEEMQLQIQRYGVRSKRY